jgi:hypothetical protein
MRLLLFLLIGFLTTTALKASQLDSIPLLIPSGLHEVSHTSYSIKEGLREMTIQFWYPADMVEETEEKVLPFMDKTHFSNLVQKQSSGTVYQKQANDIRKTILEKGGVNKKVLVFFSDFGMDRLLTIALYQKLASNGFVVIAIDLPDLGIVSMV